MRARGQHKGHIGKHELINSLFKANVPAPHMLFLLYKYNARQ